MTTEFVLVDQVSAGTTELFPAVPGKSYAVLNYVVVMAVAGTFAFQDGTDWMTGDMPMSINSGVSANAGPRGLPGPHEAPLFETGRGRPLQITTTGGSAHGHVTAELR